MDDDVGALDQALEGRLVAERAGHDLGRRQVAPLGHVGLAAQQQPQAKARLVQGDDEMPADEAGGAGHGGERRSRARFGILPRKRH